MNTLVELSAASMAAPSPQTEPAFQSFLKSALQSRPNHNADLLVKAYRFAEQVHQGQKRKSGTPYIHHALAVGQILSDLHQDTTTLAAGLLHDVVWQANVPLEQVQDTFGKPIAGLVDGVTKIKDLSFQSPEAEQVENFRKMFLSMAQDIRVILIKFADRLHNMRTLEHLPLETQERMALESRDIYAPLAHRLGIARIRWELEDLSLKWLEPEAYRSIQEKITLKRTEREAYIEKIRAPLQKALDEAGIRAEITGRAKNFSSINKKMKRRDKAFEEIYDLFAIRILVDTLPECYNTLGLIHSLYTPVMSRFKDFIATPKSNRYRSLHTTVVGPDGLMVEVQIRTWEMHQTAEVGIAAHWRYKEGEEKASDLDQHMSWLRSLLEWQKETTDPQEFMEELKVDLFSNEIYVFTPNGDLLQLPDEATSVDFAYAV
ncbi:MAG: RelA/SpoT family protein, partial [bacterium]|nr:RelA/SpoT family protein [bacterium]